MKRLKFKRSSKNRRHRYITKTWRWVYLSIIAGAAIIGAGLVIINYDTLVSSGRVLANANLATAALALICITATYWPAAAVYKLVAMRPIPYIPTLIIQISSSFTNRVLPASAGAAATNVRYLYKQNFSVYEAASIVAVVNFLGFIGHLSLLIFIGIQSRFNNKTSYFVLPKLVYLIALLLVIILVLIIILVPKLTALAGEIGRNLKRTVRQLFKRPWRAILALASSVTITLLYVLTLRLSASAVDVHLTMLQTLAVFTAGVTVTAITPTPGGLGGAEAALTSALIGIGIPSIQALSVTLIFRLISYWLPLIPGGISFIVALKRQYI